MYRKAINQKGILNKKLQPLSSLNERALNDAQKEIQIEKEEFEILDSQDQISIDVAKELGKYKRGDLEQEELKNQIKDLF